MMEEYKLNQIMARIEVATKESPIAIFKNIEGIRGVKSYFGRTIETNHWIKRGYPFYVGTYDKTYNSASVRRILRDAESVLN